LGILVHVSMYILFSRGAYQLLHRILHTFIRTSITRSLHTSITAVIRFT